MTTIINGDSNINLDFSTGGRITGDFSNATLANRVYAQSSTTNGTTSFGVIPNGSSTNAAYNVLASSDPGNASFAQLRVGTDTGDVRLTSGFSGTGTYLPMTFYTGGTESLRLSATSKAVILAGGSTSANGTGITFPATQSASSDANTLDDYEEGTWTPVIQGSVSNPTLTYDVQFGRYTKIGNMVYVAGYIQTSARTGGSGDMRITGLPFAVTSANSQGGSILYYNINNGVVSQTIPNADSGGTSFNGLYSSNNGGVWSTTQISGIPNGLAAIKILHMYTV